MWPHFLHLAVAVAALLNPLVNSAGVSLVDDSGHVRHHHQLRRDEGEPSFEFIPVCAALQFSYLFQRYTLSLPIMISMKPLQKLSLKEITIPADRNVTITGIKLENSDFALGSGVNVLIELVSQESAVVVFLIDSYKRYLQVKTVLFGSAVEIQHSLRLIFSGRVNNIPVLFRPIMSRNVPSMGCPLHNWIVFQRRVDGKLSFAQNWGTYMRGFGDPDGNYWMGLENMFHDTVTTNQPNIVGTRCRLKIDVVDFNGTRHINEWHQFQVLGPKWRYALTMTEPVSTTLIDKIGHSNTAAFSTYDKEHNGCSRSHGFSGWWFNALCHSGLLNGVYPTGETDANPAKIVLRVDDRWMPLQQTVMMYNCVA